MYEPIKIHIYGHDHANRLPVDFAIDNTRAWFQAFEHVVEYIAPHGLSFVLLGRGCRVHFHKGIPVKDDIDTLCATLRDQMEAKPSLVWPLMAA